MKLLKAFGIVGLLAVYDVIASASSQSEASITISTSSTRTSKSLTAPWDDPTHTPSTFTTISLTYSSYPSSPAAQITTYPALETLAQVAQADGQNIAVACSSLKHGFGLDNGPPKRPLGQVLQEQSHESLTTIRSYSTLTLTLSELDTTTLYTGPVDAETMITLDSGTHTTTEGIVTTVTDVAPSPPTVSVPEASSSIHGSVSDTLYGSATLTTQPGLPSVVPTIVTSGTETPFGSTHSQRVTTIIPTNSVGSSLTTAGDVPISSQTPSATESAAGVPPTSVGKAMGALVGVAGVMMLAF